MRAALPTPTQVDVRWVGGLHELARDWVEANGMPNSTVRTGAYVDLTFAFALARIGAVAESEERSRKANAQLAGLDDAHLLLQQIYGYRIAQARQGEEHHGPLPNEISDSLERTERLLRDVVDRLRKHSRLLEPDQRFNPYRHWGARISDFERALAELADLTDGEELARRVDDLLAKVPKGARGHEQRARVLVAALQAAPRMSEAFAQRLLDQTASAYDSLPEPREMSGWLDRTAFLDHALFVVGHFRLVDSVRPLLDRVRQVLTRLDVVGLYTLSHLLRQSIDTLTALRLGDELDSLLGEVAGLVLGGKPIDLLDGSSSENLARLHVLLCLAEGWYGFGWDRLAEPVIERVWSLLLADGLPPREKTQLTTGYSGALGKAPSDTARGRLEEVFRQLKGIKDTYTTSSHFSVSQLDVVESVAFAAVEVCRRP